jgi:hypothetical protein
MFDPFTLAMIGAGVGALTNPKKPLKGAIIGGGLGYGGGLLAAPAGATATTAATTGAATGAGAVVPGSIESAGMVTGASGNLVNPEFFAGAGTPFETFTGGQGLLSNFADDLGSNLNNLAPENLSGVASLLDGQQNTSGYQQMAGTGGGGVSRGNANNLAVQFPQAKVFKRRKA